MDANSNQELYEIKRELQAIINELDSISAGVSGDFKGIGNEKCARSILAVSEQYKTVKRKLNNIDTNTVTDEFAARKAEEERQLALAAKIKEEQRAAEKAAATETKTTASTKTTTKTTTSTKTTTTKPSDKKSSSDKDSIFDAFGNAIGKVGNALGNLFKF